jgi:hypothetical protein
MPRPSAAAPWSVLTCALSLTACSRISFPVLPPSAVSPTTYTSSVPPVLYHAYGDSITYGYGLSNPSTQDYVVFLASQLGLPFVNYAHSGDQACDLPTNQIFPNAESPTLETKAFYSLLISTNDVDVKGTGTYEAVFNLCQQASIAWLALPVEDKVLASSATVTVIGPATLDTAHNWNAMVTNAPDASVTFPFTLAAAGPLYVWYRITDGNLGSFSYAVDGSILGSGSSATLPPMQTQNGNTESLALLRLPSLPAGPHALRLTQTSPGLAGMGVVAIGIPPSTYQPNLPEVLVGTTPRQRSGGGAPCSDTLAPCSVYTSDITANVSIFARDGLNVHLFDTAKYMTGSPAEFLDSIHPNALGHAEIFRSIQDSLR